MNNVDQETGEIFDKQALIGEGHKIARHILQSWNNYTPHGGESNDKPSITVPNQSLSIREIFQRFASGQPLDVNSSMVYTGDDPAPDLKRFDIEEIHEMQRNNLENIQRRQDELKLKSAERKKKLQDEQVRKEQGDKSPGDTGTVNEKV